jgi:transcriptional regulator with XRE-family HTH domain
MAARKKETDFNDYFDFLWEYAQSRKISKGAFMKESGLSPQRFSEFSQGSRNITGEYFLKMLEGVGLTTDEVERLSGSPFSDDQRGLLQFDAFVKSQRPFLEELMKDPAKLQACKAVIKSDRVWSDPHVQPLITKLPELKKRTRPFWSTLSKP